MPEFTLPPRLSGVAPPPQPTQVRQASAELPSGLPANLSSLYPAGNASTPQSPVYLSDMSDLDPARFVEVGTDLAAWVRALADQPTLRKVLNDPGYLTFGEATYMDRDRGLDDLARDAFIVWPD